MLVPDIQPQVPTPVLVVPPSGTYNPDWAVLVEKDGVGRLYFVVETKSSLFTEDLRDKASAKMQCGKASLQGIGSRRKSCGVHAGQEHR